MFPKVLSLDCYSFWFILMTMLNCFLNFFNGFILISCQFSIRRHLMITKDILTAVYVSVQYSKTFVSHGEQISGILKVQNYARYGAAFPVSYASVPNAKLESNSSLAGFFSFTPGEI